VQHIESPIGTYSTAGLSTPTSVKDLNVVALYEGGYFGKIYLLAEASATHTIISTSASASASGVGILVSESPHASPARNSTPASPARDNSPANTEGNNKKKRQKRQTRKKSAKARVRVNGRFAGDVPRRIAVPATTARAIHDS
jgi:hypothetical protein